MPSSSIMERPGRGGSHWPRGSGSALTASSIILSSIFLPTFWFSPFPPFKPRSSCMFLLHVPPAVHLLPPNLPSIAQGSLLTALMHGELTGEYRSCFCDPRVWISALLAHPHDPHGLPRSSGVAGYYLIVREPLKLTPGSRCFSLCHNLERK